MPYSQLSRSAAEPQDPHKEYYVRPLRSHAVALVVMVLALCMASLGPVAAKGHEQPAFAVYHGPVEISLADALSDGHQLGDVRVTGVATTNADGEALGRLDATLTTTAIDHPGVGDEVRVSTLVFSFDDEAGSQIVVSGSAAYPGQGPTIATGDTTVRPIVGGSGRFAGADGMATTTHLADGGWIHEFEFGKGKPPGDHVNKAARGAAREARKEARAADKEAREADKAERKAQGGIDAGLASDPDDSTVAEVGITRTDLGLAQPATAPGQELGLWHYQIPAGSALAPHTHAGWQIARIAQGELEYTIIAGEGTLIAPDGRSRPVGPGTYTLRAGDSIVENPDLEHFGANRTKEPVTIVAATLYTQGAPLSLPLDSPAAETPEASLEPAA